MKAKRTLLFTCFTLSTLFAFAQDNNEPQLYISKKVKEADGTYTSESIIKKGKAAAEFNIDEYVKANKADNTDLEIRLEGGDEERSVTIRGSQGPRNTGAEDVEVEVEELVRNVNGRVNRSVERINKSINTGSWGNGNYSISYDNGNDAFLGVEEDEDEDEDQDGVVVEITNGSAAEKAGLRDNDVLLQLNDSKINRWSDITKFMNNAKKGDKVKVKYLRNGKEMTTEAELTNRRSVDENNWNGQSRKRGFLGVSEFGDVEDEPGVRVSITKNSGAEKAGLKKGDVILELNGATINDFEDIEDAMDDVKPGDKIKVKYKRDGKESTIEATAGECNSWDWGQVDWENNDINVQTKKGCLGICNNNDATTGDRRGVAISNVTCSSPANLAGLRCGDIIFEINGKRIDNGNDLWNELARYTPQTSIEIAYVRDGKDLLAEATLNTCEDSYEQVTMTKVDESGNASERKFYAWNVNEEEEEELKLRQTITIHSAADSDVPVLNPGNGYENAPFADEHQLELQNIKMVPGNEPGHLVLSFSTEAIPTLINMYDMNGRQLFLEELNAFNGNYRQEFDFKEMAKTNVILRIQQGNKTYHEQFFID